MAGVLRKMLECTEDQVSQPRAQARTIVTGNTRGLGDVGWHPGRLLASSAPSRRVPTVCIWHKLLSQGSPSRSARPVTSGPMAPFPSRSFESNLNTYKRLAIKLPDDQIVKVGDAALPREPPPCSPRTRASGLPGCAPTMRLRHVWRGHSLPSLVSQSNCTVAIINVGAPAAGMNAAVRSAVRVGIADGHKMLAIYDGFEGFAKGQVSPWGASWGTEDCPSSAANLRLREEVDTDAALWDAFCSGSILGFALWALQGRSAWNAPPVLSGGHRQWGRGGRGGRPSGGGAHRGCCAVGGGAASRHSDESWWKERAHTSCVLTVYTQYSYEICKPEISAPFFLRRNGGAQRH